jgi:hypothetical protein
MDKKSPVDSVEVVGSMPTVLQFRNYKATSKEPELN